MQTLRHPVYLLILRWNWKAALLSALFRAPIFFVASLHQGLALAFAGAGVEAAFNAAGAGLYGAFLQNIRRARPPWLAWMVGACLVPALIQLAENAFHYMAGTSQLHRGIIISICLSAASAMFNLFIMRSGTLLTGPEGKTLLRDLGNMPRLMLDFILIGPRWLSVFFSDGPAMAHKRVQPWSEKSA